LENFHPASPNLRLRQERIQHNWHQQKLADLLGTTQVTISRWEGGSQQPSPYFREKLCALFDKSAQDLGLIPEEPSSSITQQDAPEIGAAQSSSTETPGLWTVPYLRNPHFTGREDLLEQLTQRLSPQESASGNICRAALTQPQAIKGLGGIGKTQIAVEYTYRAREQGRYTHFFWVNAANEEAIITSFLALADLLPDFPAGEEKDRRKLIAAIHYWLQECRDPWLLIVDNADDPTLIQPYLPQQGLGSILLTTRVTAVGWLATPLEVEQMGLMEGTRFLLHRTRCLSTTDDEESNEASNVVIALDGFPLALDQAGAYIEETGCSFGNYLQLYEQHRGKMLARRGKQATNYPDSVATTWSLSFQQIEQDHPAAAELLRLCAYLSPDHIPEELLIQGAAYWPVQLQQAVTDSFTFNELLETLLAFSLVKRLAHKRLLSLHRLVQAVQMDRMDSEEQCQWAQRVVYAVNALFPADAREPDAWPEAWPLCLRYLEQVQACDRLIQRYCLQQPEAADLLERAGIYLREHASYSLAESLFKRGLAIAEQQSGPQHLLVASLLNNLGSLYREQGKYKQAEPLHQRSAHIREQVLGPHHPLLASPLNNLGILYWWQGKYEQAEFLLQRALSIREQALGPSHSQVALLLNNLGILYDEQGKYDLAEPLLQRALSIWEQTLGPHHPQLALALENLGILYYELGKHEQAEPLYQRALDIREKALGPHHPQLASTLNNLGILYDEQGKHEQAEPLLQRALSIWEQALGPHHPQLAHALSSLANLSRNQGWYEQAELLYLRALAIRQKHLGPQHIEFAETLQDLARLREIQQQRNEALPLYQQALAIREQVLGAEHPKALDTCQRLYSVLQALGKAEEAAVLAAHLDTAKQEEKQNEQHA
jgi:tetratricopeptide (TPR) repeat protein/transcriptional regulator with XRE-family HTH domain